VLSGPERQALRQDAPRNVARAIAARRTVAARHERREYRRDVEIPGAKAGPGDRAQGLAEGQAWAPIE